VSGDKSRHKRLLVRGVTSEQARHILEN
jgi:hypothetical protein